MGQTSDYSCDSEKQMRQAYLHARTGERSFFFHSDSVNLNPAMSFRLPPRHLTRLLRQGQGHTDAVRREVAVAWQLLEISCNGGALTCQK